MIEYIGIDIGGTNIRVGAIDEKENLVCINSERTHENVTNASELYDKIKRMIKSITDYGKVKGIGVGFPGAINKDGKIMTARNIEIFKNFDLVQRLQKDFEVPVTIANDARVAALSEAVKGAGKKGNTVVYITLSTGLGGGVVIDNKIYYGATNLGGYFSRMILDGNNIAENLISGTALVKEANKKLNMNFENAQEIFSLANKNAVAKDITDTFKKNLVNLLLNVTITLSPDIIVLGGGVMKAKKYFLQDVIEQFKQRAHSFAVDTKIVEAKLKEPGVIGAALNVKNK